MRSCRISTDTSHGGADMSHGGADMSYGVDSGDKYLAVQTLGGSLKTVGGSCFGGILFILCPCHSAPDFWKFLHILYVYMNIYTPISCT